jgi:hypothetical protein
MAATTDATAAFVALLAFAVSIAAAAVLASPVPRLPVRLLATVPAIPDTTAAVSRAATMKAVDDGSALGIRGALKVALVNVARPKAAAPVVGGTSP